jgi:hypothetical protein
MVVARLACVATCASPLSIAARGAKFTQETGFHLNPIRCNGQLTISVISHLWRGQSIHRNETGDLQAVIPQDEPSTITWVRSVTIGFADVNWGLGRVYSVWTSQRWEKGWQK